MMRLKRTVNELEMHYNDINNRIERIYNSIQIKKEDGISEYLKFEHRTGHFVSNENELLIKILLIISNLSNLKDHLKNVIEQKGGNKQIIEDEIKNNLHLQLIIDINNAEKHGYPVTRKRSHLDPKIVNLSSSLILVGDRNSLITIHKDGKIGKQGDIPTKINADIFDKDDNKICSLDELVRQSVTAWERVINDNGIALIGVT